MNNQVSVAINKNQVSAANQISKGVEEVRISILTAKQFPRDIDSVLKIVQQNTSRPRFAEKSLYSYPRGNTQVEGPSIRLAEMLANAYGNLNYGIGEIERGDDYSIVQAYCHDLQTNVKKIMQFELPHYREARNKRIKLTSDRDIYELIANHGSRRVRNAILALLPADIVDIAIEQVRNTLETKFDDSLYKNAKSNLCRKYFNEDKEKCKKAVENMFRKNVDSLTVNEKIQLISIVNSLENGMSSVADWFTLDSPIVTSIPVIETVDISTPDIVDLTDL